jgi:endonuclease YncB( thermonuclease family)
VDTDTLRWLAFTLIPVLLEVLLAHVAFAADFSCLVVSVLDGDSNKVLHNQHPECMYLSGIDCPVMGQSVGKKATGFTSTFKFGKEVTVQICFT